MELQPALQRIEAPVWLDDPNVSMRSWAAEHARDSGGVAVIRNPLEMPSVHDLEAHIEGNPINDFVKLREVARFAEPHMDTLIDKSQENWGITEKALEILLSGDNLLLSANHHTAPDQAVLLAAIKSNILELIEEIRRSSPMAADQVAAPFESAIVMSHLMSYVNNSEEAGGLPMIEPPKLAADHLLMTMPDSPSVDRHFWTPDSEEWVGRKRKAMLRPLLGLLNNEDGLLWSMSAGGTTDKILQPGVKAIGGVQSTTSRLAQRNTYVLQMGYAVVDGVVHFGYVEEPIQISSDGEMQELMGGSATLLNSSMAEAGQTEFKFEYQPPERSAA